ncbi:MAG: HAD hydrolase-like protein [Actinomycetota bacterium]
MAWILDLDGVVWLERRAVPGSVEAIAELRRLGHRVVFATNFSHGRHGEIVDALAAIGIDAEGDVATSAMAAGTLIEPGERVHVLGGPGIEEAVEAAGGEVVGPGAPTDVVVAGWTRAFDFAALDAAFQAVRGGARLVATNTDRTYPTPQGPLPGGGSIVAAVEWASGTASTIAGKPHEPMAALVRALVASDPGSPPTGAVDSIMIGDRPETDGLFAATLEVPFGLVATGVSAADVGGDVPTAHRGSDLAELVSRLVGS